VQLTAPLWGIPCGNPSDLPWHDLRAHLPMVAWRDGGDSPDRRNEPFELEQRHVVGAGGERRLLGRFRWHRRPLVPVGGPLTVKGCVKPAQGRARLGRSKLIPRPYGRSKAIPNSQSPTVRLPPSKRLARAVSSPKRPLPASNYSLIRRSRRSRRSSECWQDKPWRLP
jgi:hypothetical protein